MHEVNIKNIDLNLLSSLEALIETGSVSKAAERVNLSQPAMSRALERLRHLLKDPLLVRSGRSMVLTPRAEGLREPLRDTLAHVSNVLRPPIFDPAQAQNHFRIMAPDYVAQMLLGSVFGRAFALAPKITIEMESISAKAIEGLRAGEIDLGFGVVNDGPDLSMLYSQSLFDDRLVCLMRKDHPLAKVPLNLEGYANASHALLSITGRGGSLIDARLKELGQRRHIALRLSQFLAIPSVITPSDVIITVPERLAHEVLSPKLVMRELPDELILAPFTFSQIWHGRFSQNPAHMWLRRMVKDHCSRL